MTDSSRNIGKLIRELDSHIAKARDGWPEDLFLFVSRITPLVNVDLLIQDERGRTLLTWRRDQFYGPGWHVPGGIIRFQETAASRIRMVAARELGAEVEFDASPILVQESIVPGRQDRGHFISLLYKCRLVTTLDPRLQCKQTVPMPDQWRWHESCPADLLREQHAYAAFMN